MKTPRLLSVSLVALAVTLPAVAAPETAKPDTSRIQVTYVDPEKFTDVKDDYFGTEKGRDNYLDQLKEYIVERANRRLPAGQTLSVSVTDIDMAGDFEPWRGPTFNDVRIVKDIYPPRIDLSFKITGADGKVVAEGKRELRDLSFLMNLSIDRQDPLRHEKNLLDDWMRRDL
ncbi:MAG TPA: DUF3016 domain-containing protein, partial [Opitutaceae bacterium]